MMRRCLSFVMVVLMMGPGCAASNDGASMTKRHSGDAQAGGPSRGAFHTVRFTPGTDPRGELERYAMAHGLRAAAVVSAVGSLDTAMIRMADEKESRKIEGPLEVVSLSGTISPDGAHLHISVSDRAGQTIGGHLSAGSMVRTTLEVVLVELADLQFSREQDAETGYKELRIAPRK